jgi:hypothetical protein
LHQITEFHAARETHARVLKQRSTEAGALVLSPSSSIARRVTTPASRLSHSSSADSPHSNSA